VIPSQDGDSVAVLDFKEKDIEESLYAIESTIDIITHE
jgi:hypothetical protein